MTHNSNHHTPEADKPMGVDRSLLEFLKPKAEERYSKLEAYCDLLSKATSGAYQALGTEGTLQLLPGQFITTISELARQWQWQRATVRQFISGLTNLGQLSVEPYSKSFIFSVNLEQRLSLLIESPDDILDFCAMQFVRFIKGRTTAEEVADSYSRYYDLKMNILSKKDVAVFLHDVYSTSRHSCSTHWQLLSCVFSTWKKNCLMIFLIL